MALSNSPAVASRICQRLPDEASAKRPDKGSKYMTMLAFLASMRFFAGISPTAAECASRPLDLALLLQHAHAVAQRGQGVLEFGLAMGRRGDAARAAAEVDAAGHHRQAEFLHHPGPAFAR